MKPSENPSQFVIQVVNPNASNIGLEKITGPLATQLHDAPGVVAITKAHSAHDTANNIGSKTADEVAAIGTIVLSLLPLALPQLIDWLKVWTTRDKKNSIKLMKQVGENQIVLEVSADTPKEKVQEYLELISKYL